MTARRVVRVLARLFVFILIFCLEVRVRASVEEPGACWKAKAEAGGQKGPCAVHTAPGEKLSLEVEGGRLVLDESTTLVRMKEGWFRILSGQVWVRAESAVRVTSEFGDFVSESGEFWVSRTRDRVTGSAITGLLRMSPRGAEGEELEILPGLENWLGRVPLGSRRAETGVPMAIPFTQHLSRWARLYSGGREKFTQEAEAFHDVWSKAATEAAGVHQQLFERKVASLKEQQRKDDEARRKVEARNRELIEMFKRKVFDP